MSDSTMQDAIEQLYAELGKAIVLRREYCKEKSCSPPIGADSVAPSGGGRV